MIQRTHKELAELVRQAQAKDSEAFARLYEATYQQLYYYILSLVHSQQDAEDLVQNIYIIVLKKLDSLKDGSVFVAWINHIAYNECMHLLSARKNAPSGELFDSEATTLPDQSDDHDPLLQSVKSDRERRVMAALETLSPEYKTVLLMQYYNNMKLADIAVVLDCPLGTVKSRANTAKQQLKKALAGQEELRFNMFIPFALPGVLKASASHISMPAVTARKGLEAALSEAGMSTNVTFVPAASAAPAVSATTIAATGAGVGAVGVAAVGAAVLVLSGPGITSTSFDTALARQTTVVVATSGVNDENGVIYTAPDGAQYQANAAGSGEYQFVATQNGLYTIEVFGGNDRSATATVTIDNLDYTAPVVADYSWDGDILTLHISDDRAGADFSAIRAIGAAGEFAPQQIDEATGTVVFVLQQEEFTVSVRDLLGNENTYLVTVS